jgi:predicted exporter
MKQFMRIDHKKLRLIAVFLMSLAALITAKQVAAEINALLPQNETDSLVTLNNAFRAGSGRRQHLLTAAKYSFDSFPECSSWFRRAGARHEHRHLSAIQNAAG